MTRMIEVYEGDRLVRRVANGWLVQIWERDGFEGAVSTGGGDWRCEERVYEDDPKAPDSENPAAQSWLNMARETWDTPWRWKRTAGVEARYYSSGREDGDE